MFLDYITKIGFKKENYSSSFDTYVYDLSNALQIVLTINTYIHENRTKSSICVQAYSDNMLLFQNNFYDNEDEQIISEINNYIRVLKNVMVLKKEKEMNRMFD